MARLRTLPCRSVTTQVRRDGSDDPESDAKRPIRVLHDRLLVRLPGEAGERKSTGGILIPATAQLSKRLVWGEVVAAGPNVRSVEPGDASCSPPRTASRSRCRERTS